MLDGIANRAPHVRIGIRRAHNVRKEISYPSTESKGFGPPQINHMVSKSAWEVVDVPNLRIVTNVLWEKVKARQEALKFEIARTADGNALNRAHRRKFLF